MSVPAPLVGALLVALRDLVRAEVAAALREQGAGEPDTYTSTRLPPGCPSRRAFATRCRSIAGAQREGAGRASRWIVPREAWHEALLVRRGGATTASPRADAPDLDAMLASSGLRSTRAA